METGLCAWTVFCILSAGGAAQPLVPAGPSPVVVLDPGHGGTDLGAVVNKRVEKGITLAVARKARERLESRGIRTRMTREEDVFVPLDERMERGREAPETVFVSIHVNDTGDRSLSGPTIYAFGKSGQRWRRTRRGLRLPRLSAPPRETVRESSDLASSIAKAMRADGFKTEWPARAEYYVLRNPKHPSVLVELGYLSNPAEAARLADGAYQDRLADALALGLSRYFAAAARRARPATVANR